MNDEKLFSLGLEEDVDQDKGEVLEAGLKEMQGQLRAALKSFEDLRDGGRTYLPGTEDRARLDGKIEILKSTLNRIRVLLAKVVEADETLEALRDLYRRQVEDVERTNKAGLYNAYNAAVQGRNKTRGLIRARERELGFEESRL